MIASKTVAEIRRLLADGTLSQRKIAKQMGVSRGTVGTIAAGKRPDYDALRVVNEAEAEEEPPGPPERCPRCGGRVLMPCRLCKLRERSANQSRNNPPGLPEEPPGLNLRPDHRARYDEVRQWRRTHQEQPWNARENGSLLPLEKGQGENP